jgi:hypothetical protein
MCALYCLFLGFLVPNAQVTSYSPQKKIQYRPNHESVVEARALFPQNENWLEKRTEDHLVETAVDHGSRDALTSSLVA